MPVFRLHPLRRKTTPTLLLYWESDPRSNVSTHPSLRCRTICTRRSAESLPTSRPLSPIHGGCFPNPGFLGWNIWSCSWCQTWASPVGTGRSFVHNKYVEKLVPCALLPLLCSVSCRGVCSCGFVDCARRWIFPVLCEEQRMELPLLPRWTPLLTGAPEKGE